MFKVGQKVRIASCMHQDWLHLFIGQTTYILEGPLHADSIRANKTYYIVDQLPGMISAHLWEDSLKSVEIQTHMPSWF